MIDELEYSQLGQKNQLYASSCLNEGYEPNDQVTRAFLLTQKAARVLVWENWVTVRIRAFFVSMNPALYSQ